MSARKSKRQEPAAIKYLEPFNNLNKILLFLDPQYLWVDCDSHACPLEAGTVATFHRQHLE